MNRVEKIKHKGKEILYINYEGLLTDSEMIGVVEEAESVLLSENKPYLRLINITDTYATSAFMLAVKKSGKRTKKLVIKTAIIGAIGAKKMLLRSYTREMQIAEIRNFETEEEAKEYLIE